MKNTKKNQKITKAKKSNVLSYFDDWTLFEKLWLSIFTIVNIYLFITWQDTWIGLTASLTGMLCVVLVAKGKISNYYFGIVNIFAYSYVSYMNKYYGEVMLNMLFFLPMSFVGLFFWMKNRKNGKTKDDVLVNHLTAKEFIIWIAICVPIIILYGLFLKYLGNTLPYVDATTVTLSIVATILMTKRVTEQWLFWIVIDVFSIGMWLYRLMNGGNDISILVMWIAFLVNAIYGYLNWRKLERD